MSFDNYDLVIALRLLERKLMRVESGLYVYEMPELDAYGEIRPAWNTADDLDRGGRQGFWGFEIAYSPWDPQDRDHGEEYEGTLLHELVHAAWMERYGLHPSPRVRCLHPDDAGVVLPGQLCYACTAKYYRDPYERAAKIAEIKLVYGERNRRDWGRLLRDPDPESDLPEVSTEVSI